MAPMRTIPYTLIAVAMLTAFAAANTALRSEAESDPKPRSPLPTTQPAEKADANQSTARREDARALHGTWVGQLKRDDKSIRVVLFVRSTGKVTGLMGRYDAPASAVLSADCGDGGRSLQLTLDKQTRFVSPAMTLSKLMDVQSGREPVELAPVGEASEATGRATFHLTRRCEGQDALALIPDSFDISQLTVKGTADTPLRWLAVCRELGASDDALGKGLSAALNARAKIAELNRKLGPNRRSMSVYMKYLRMLESIRKTYLAKLGETLDDQAADALRQTISAVGTFEDDAAILIAAMKASDDEPARRRKAAHAYRAFVRKRTAAIREALKSCAEKPDDAKGKSAGDDASGAKDTGDATE
ncbi:MAG: hypothetical protein ACLFVH_08320 [Phycisphaerae bacterium]